MTEIVHELPLESRKTLRLNAIITFLGFLDTHLLIPIMALYAAELGAGLGMTGLIIGIYSITNTPANILFGRLIDRVGHRAPLIVGLIGDAVSMFLYALARLPVQLLLLRAFHGATGGLVGPATMSIMANYSPPARKGRAMSVYGIALALTTLVGYGLSGLMASRFGYQAIFLLGAAVLVVAAGLSITLPGARKGDGQVAQAGSASARALMKRKGLITAYASIFAQYFAFGGVVTLLPIYVKGAGMEAFHVGMLLAIFAVVFIALQFPTGSISDRAGRLAPAVAGLSLGIVSLVLLPSAAVFGLLAAVMAVYGAAYGLLFPAISALVADNTSAEERGLGTGLFHAFLTAGVALGAPVIGWAGSVVGVEVGLRLSASFMVAALVLAIRLRR